MKKLKNVLVLFKRIVKIVCRQKTKILFSFFLLTPIVCFYYYAKNEKLLSVFFGFWSKVIFQVVISLLADGIIIFLIKCVLKKKVFLAGMITTLVIILLFSISGVLEIKSLHYKKSESVNNYSDIADSYKSDNFEKYAKIPYIFEDDPFFTEKREEYFGIKKGSLTEGEEIVKYIAKIIFEDMKNTKIEHTEIPRLYEDCTQAAELLYQTYMYQRDRDWSKRHTYAIIVSKNCRIDVLVKAKDERVNGDSEYQDYENRRIISIYFKELGDEYVQDNNQKKASEMFKESIKWAMKSLYTAYANKKYEKMKTVYNDLDNSLSALEQLDEINNGNISNVRLCCDAYKLIIDEYLPC